MEKINIAELLKNCPTGMELDCTMYEDVSFAGITENLSFPIRVKINVEDIKGGNWTKEINLTAEGKLGNHPNSKCVIFPKGKTSWEGFVPPCKFKDGDVLTYMYYNKPTIYIYRENGCCNTSYYAGYSFANESFYKGNVGGLWGDRTDLRLATEEEKTQLFDAIKANGYEWNPETKTLEKLLKFKIGDRVRCITNIDNKFKIIGIADKYYICENNFRIYFKFQEYWELVPNKFEINTLKPFDQVLVRNSDKGRWVGQFYTVYNRKEEYPFECVYNCWKYCIPYKGNEHLLDKTDDCSDYYKTWE